MATRATFYPNQVYQSGSDVEIQGELTNGTLLPGMKSQEQTQWQIEWLKGAGSYTDAIESGVTEAKFVVMKVMNATLEMIDNYIQQQIPMRFYY